MCSEGRGAMMKHCRHRVRPSGENISPYGFITRHLPLKSLSFICIQNLDVETCENSSSCSSRWLLRNKVWCHGLQLSHSRTHMGNRKLVLKLLPIKMFALTMDETNNQKSFLAKESLTKRMFKNNIFQFLTGPDQYGSFETDNNTNFRGENYRYDG